jgi:regulator of nucleoside diphosphate kinase
MFWRKPTTTITRPDRDRLVEVTRARANLLSWTIFIDNLRRELERARVVEANRVSPQVVTMHSKVQVLDPTQDRRQVFTLVYPQEADLSAGQLSVLSAMGTALLGARTGDIVKVLGAAGPRAIKVEAVLYQPEAAERIRSRVADMEVVSRICNRRTDKQEHHHVAASFGDANDDALSPGSGTPCSVRRA